MEEPGGKLPDEKAFAWCSGHEIQDTQTGTAGIFHRIPLLLQEISASAMSMR